MGLCVTTLIAWRNREGLVAGVPDEQALHSQAPLVTGVYSVSSNTRAGRDMTRATSDSPPINWWVK